MVSWWIVGFCSVRVLHDPVTRFMDAHKMLNAEWNYSNVVYTDCTEITTALKLHSHSADTHMTSYKISGDAIIIESIKELLPCHLQRLVTYYCYFEATWLCSCCVGYILLLLWGHMTVQLLCWLHITVTLRPHDCAAAVLVTYYCYFVTAWLYSCSVGYILLLLWGHMTVQLQCWLHISVTLRPHDCTAAVLVTYYCYFEATWLYSCCVGYVLLLLWGYLTTAAVLVRYYCYFEATWLYSCCVGYVLLLLWGYMTVQLLSWLHITVTLKPHDCTGAVYITRFVDTWKLIRSFGKF